MAKNGNLTAKQRAFVRALLSERDTKAAAAACGVAYRTACRWMTQAAIHAALIDAEGDALSEVTRGLLRLSSEAVATLGGAMSDGAAAAGAKVRAADIVLTRLLQLRELVTLEERVTALEAQQ